VKLKLETSEIEFQACGPFAPRLDKEGVHRRDKDSRLALWAVELVAWSSGEGRGQTETILVTVAAEAPPSLNQMDWVTVHGLTAIPWVPDNGSRSVRIAYRADSVTPMAESMKKAS
jgi:hypothetical protein